MKAFLSFLRHHYVGILTLIAVYVIVHFLVLYYHRPGSMTVIEAQAMNMSQSGTPVGSIPVGAITVNSISYQPTVEYTGNVIPYNEIVIYPRVTGVLESVYVYPGQRVHAGEVVARLDSVELNSRLREAEFGSQAAREDYQSLMNERMQALAQQASSQANVQAYKSKYNDGEAQVNGAKSAVNAAQSEYQAVLADLNVAKSNLKSTDADAKYWKAEIARERQLYKAKAVSTDELQTEEAKYRTANANVQQALATIVQKNAKIAVASANVSQMEAGFQSAKSQLSRIQAQISSAKADFAASKANTAAIADRMKRQKALAQQATAQQKTASIVRNYTLIRTDQDGLVTQRLVSPGTLVQPGMPILQIDNTSTLRVQATVAQIDFGNIRTGNPVTIRVPEQPTNTLMAHVTSIFDSANNTGRTVIVEALVQNPPSWLIPGQYIVMDIGLGQSKSMISIPYSAIRYDVNQRPYVWTIRQISGSGIQTYTCLMHPFIHEDHPGKCPICGMTLVPEKRGGNSVAHRVFITLGIQSQNSVEVVMGLQSGDVVITHGNEDLQEGNNVTVEQWSNGGPVSLPAPSGKMKAMPGMSMPSGSGNGNGSSGSMPGMNMPSASGNGSSSSGSMPGMNMPAEPKQPNSQSNSQPKSQPKSGSQPSSPPNGANSMKNMPGM